MTVLRQFTYESIYFCLQRYTEASQDSEYWELRSIWSGGERDGHGGGEILTANVWWLSWTITQCYPTHCTFFTCTSRRTHHKRGNRSSDTEWIQLLYISYQGLYIFASISSNTLAELSYPTHCSIITKTSGRTIKEVEFYNKWYWVNSDTEFSSSRWIDVYPHKL